MTKSYLNFKNRINFLTGGILIVWSLFVFRLSQIQIVNATEKTQGLRQEKIEGNRGNIFDVNNISITQNLTFYQIAVRSEELTNKETFIKDISKCTGVDVDTYSKKMNDRSYVILEKKTRKDCEYLKSKYPKSLEIKEDYKEAKRKEAQKLQELANPKGAEFEQRKEEFERRILIMDRRNKSSSTDALKMS